MTCKCILIWTSRSPTQSPIQMPIGVDAVWNMWFSDLKYMVHCPFFILLVHPHSMWCREYASSYLHGKFETLVQHCHRWMSLMFINLEITHSCFVLHRVHYLSSIYYLFLRYIIVPPTNIHYATQVFSNLLILNTSVLLTLTILFSAKYSVMFVFQPYVLITDGHPSKY